MRFKPPQKAKRDGNEPLIVDELQKHGFTVEQLDKPVDLAISRHDRTWLAEVKNPEGRNKVEPAQERFFARWPVAVPIFRTVEDVQDFAALTAIGARTVIKGVNDG